MKRSGRFCCGIATIAFVVSSPPSWAADRLESINIRKVKLAGEIGRRVDITVNNHLLAIDVDKDFLAPFRNRPAVEVYIGLGKFIDALSRLAAYTGEEKVLAMRRHVVETVLSMQEPDGYIGIFKPEQRVNALWDIHEMSYIIYGLCTDARLFEHKPALDAATKLADFIIARLEAEPNNSVFKQGIAQHVALTGFEEALLALSEQTGNPKYRNFVIGYRKLPEWNCPLHLGRSADIVGHAYAYICRCVAQLRLQRVSPDERLLQPTRNVMEFLTHGNGMVITGTCGDHECWHDTQAGTVNLGETCTTAYMIRWFDEQLRMTGDSRLGDLMERAIYNALFAAQSPDGRQIRYYTPFDGPRQYFPKDTYCCPGNFRRIISELPLMMYYRSPDGVCVNLYGQSQAALELTGDLKLQIQQETDYPSSGNVVIHMNPNRPAKFALSLRVPRWCERAFATVTSGTETTSISCIGGQFLRVDREWRPGDRVDLNLPMTLRCVKGRVNQAGRFAVMYGPTVFALNPKRNPELAKHDLRLLVAYLPSLKGPVKDESVRPNGLACSLRAWTPGAWYPAGEPSVELPLSEFADPSAVATYFFNPDPASPVLVDDELIAR